MLAALLAAALAPAAFAQEWKPGPASAGFRGTAGSGGYWAGSFEGRASMGIDRDTSAYTRFDYTTDQLYRWLLSWTLGAEQELKNGWFGRAGAGIGKGSFRGASRDSSNSFLIELGAGHAVGDWWGDLEYKLTAGRIARVFVPVRFPGGGRLGSPGLGTQAKREKGVGSSAGAPVTSDFTQHDATLYFGGPTPKEGVSAGFGFNVWTRTGGAGGISESFDVGVRLRRGWSASAVVTFDQPSGASGSVFAGLGLRKTVDPGGL